MESFINICYNKKEIQKLPHAQNSYHIIFGLRSCSWTDTRRMENDILFSIIQWPHSETSFTRCDFHLDIKYVWGIFSNRQIISRTRSHFFKHVFLIYIQVIKWQINYKIISFLVGNWFRIFSTIFLIKNQAAKEIKSKLVKKVVK